MSIFDSFKKIESSKVIGPVEYIVAGLGNPGKEYENTRHNAGFLTIDKLVEKYNTKADRLKFKSLCAEVMINGKKCLIMKPSTYMNNSGEAITQAMRFYKIPIEKVLVIFDDISLEPGSLRVRRKGSDGGHNGIKNIVYLSGSNNFPRIKIGVGKKPHPDYNLADWVLSKLSASDTLKLNNVMGDAISAIELIVSGDIDSAMNKYNS